MAQGLLLRQLLAQLIPSRVAMDRKAGVSADICNTFCMLALGGGGGCWPHSGTVFIVLRNSCLVIAS